MQMPKPTKFHKKLEALVGDWSGDEVMHPMPHAPEGGKAKGKTKVRWMLDGLAIVQEYEQRSGGKVTFRGHGVIGYDTNENCYVWHWSDTMGGVPCTATKGQWDGKVLRFQHQGPMGHARYSYTFGRGGRYAFAIDVSQDGQQWAPMMSADYARKPTKA
jgi:hypothetical protein